MIMKFRKKPIVIDAVQVTKRELIHTLEGDLTAEVGDWIITGVEGELESELWQRAQRALVVIPEVRLMSAGRSAAGYPEILEGIVDLAFKEAEGWVIADYKTDIGTDPDFEARSDAYRSQVELYAECWSAITGEPVKERVLVYTTQQRTESW